MTHLYQLIEIFKWLNFLGIIMVTVKWIYVANSKVNKTYSIITTQMLFVSICAMIFSQINLYSSREKQDHYGWWLTFTVFMMITLPVVNSLLQQFEWDLQQRILNE